MHPSGAFCSILGNNPYPICIEVTTTGEMRCISRPVVDSCKPEQAELSIEILPVVNGTLTVPEGPGLGVELDENMVAKWSELYKSDPKWRKQLPGLGKKNSYLWF